MQTQKISWADNIRFFATVGVVLLHASAPGIYKFGKISDFDWGFLNIVDSATRCCVPLFVMLSGALLLRQDKELLPYLKNRFWRVLVPFLFWALVYCLVYIANIWNTTDWKNLFDNLTDTLKDIVFFRAEFKRQAFHLWYVYMILGLYLVVPIIRKWIKNATEKEIIYFLILWVITLFIGSNSSKFFYPNIQLTFFSGYLGYFVLGYYLSMKNFELSPFLNKTLGIICLFLIIATSVGTYFLSKQKGALDETLFEYLSPNIVLLSATVFLWFKTVKISKTPLNKWISLGAQYSFGIYLVHRMIMNTLSYWGLDWTFIHPTVGVPLTTVVSFIVSLGIIYFLQKIPGGKRISG